LRHAWRCACACAAKRGARAMRAMLALCYAAILLAMMLSADAMTIYFFIADHA